MIFTLFAEGPNQYIRRVDPKKHIRRVDARHALREAEGVYDFLGGGRVRRVDVAEGVKDKNHAKHDFYLICKIMRIFKE